MRDDLGRPKLTLRAHDLQFGWFNVIVERHGTDRREWPAALRRADSAGVARFGDEHRDRVRFHQWLQWLLDEQLAAAGAAVQ